MSDVALAKSLFEVINGGHCDGVKAKLGRVYEAVRNAHKARAGEDRLRPWTHRKVRGIWEENAVVKYYEMMELAEAAAKEKQARESLQSARKEHAEFVAQTRRIQALLVSQDPDFHHGEIERLGNIARRMDSPGNQERE